MKKATANNKKPTFNNKTYEKCITSYSTHVAKIYKLKRCITIAKKDEAKRKAFQAELEIETENAKKAWEKLAEYTEKKKEYEAYCKEHGISIIDENEVNEINNEIKEAMKKKKDKTLSNASSNVPSVASNTSSNASSIVPSSNDDVINCQELCENSYCYDDDDDESEDELKNMEEVKTPSVFDDIFSDIYASSKTYDSEDDDDNNNADEIYAEYIKNMNKKSMENVDGIDAYLKNLNRSNKSNSVIKVKKIKKYPNVQNTEVNKNDNVVSVKSSSLPLLKKKKKHDA